MLEQMMIGYRLGLKDNRGSKIIASDKPECVRVIMRRAMARTWKQLARERLKDTRPSIPRGERFWPLTQAEGAAIEGLLQDEAVRQLVTSLKARDDSATLEVLDAAYWMKGCSSLGRLRFAVLINVTNGNSKEDDFCLLDIKEATPAAAPRARNARMPRDNGQRVVEGARHLSPALGDRMTATQFLRRSVVVRELMPQDLKLEMDRLSRDEAVEAARYLAEVVGKAHARQMDGATRKAFHDTFRVPRSKRLDAPSWLWTSVVELAAAHESAYLEHCHRYALAS